MILGFSDPGAEQAFQLQYGWPACAAGIAATTMGLLAHCMYALRALLHPQHCAFPAHILHNAAASIAAGVFYLALYVIFGKQRFVISRGLHSVWQRMLFAVGVLFYSRPGSCAAAGYCQVLWQHRLFLVHLVGAGARVPCGWYWFGGAVSWLLAVAVDVVDPGAACESVLCVLAALQSQAAADPRQLLHDVVYIALCSARVFAVDVVLPGLLLTWLELRARRAWWQQQQQQQRQQRQLQQTRSEAAAANSSSKAATAAATTPTGAAVMSSNSNSSSSSSNRLTATTTMQLVPIMAARSTISKQALHGTAAPAEDAALSPGPAPVLLTQSKEPPSQHAALQLPAKALPAAKGLRRQQQQQHSAPYSSPVQRCVISLKFSKAPAAGEPHHEQVVGVCNMTCSYMNVPEMAAGSAHVIGQVAVEQPRALMVSWGQQQITRS
jgi:hypothetical protein